MVDIFLTHNSEDREAFYGRALEKLQALGNVRLNPTDRNLSTAELIEAARGCQIIVSHRAAHGPREVFDNSPDLVAFLRGALDIRDIDVPAASANGVLIANAGPAFVPATAELAVALMLAVSRDVVECTLAYREGRSPPSDLGQQLAGSTAGVIGYGQVGRYLCDLLVAFNMRVLVNDPYAHVEREGIEQVDLPTLLGESDFVLPLAVATEETENLIDADAFARMKPGAVFVNVSRGNLVDEAALEAAYSEGRVGRLGLDVGRAEDQRPSPRLAKLPRVVATPHLGGSTPQNVDAQAMSSVEQAAEIIQGRIPPRAINPEHASRLARMKPA